MAVNTKRYLDLDGLKVYDRKIREIINKIDEKVGDVSSVTTDTIKNLAQALSYEIERAKTADEGFEAKIGADESAGSILGRLHALEAGETGMTEADVNQLINVALTALIDGAPDTFDTLKEIADWIAKDEEGTAQLIADVASNKNTLSELRPYVDAQDASYFNAISSIDTTELDAMFKNKVTIDAGADVQAAIAALGADDILMLSADIASNIEIPSGVTVDGNGHTMSGAVKVAPDAVVMNAVFTGKVTVA